MAHILAARIGESTTTTGTGNYTVSGAFLGHRTFGSVANANDYFYGFVEAVDAEGNPTGDWEEGLYTMVDETHIARTTIHASSNAGAAVNWGAGTKRIRMSMTSALARTLVAGSVPMNGGTGGGTTPSGARPVVPNQALYGDLVFQDEFNGNSLDTTKWSVGIWYNQEDPTVNYSVSGGCLNIWPALNGAGRYFNRTITTDGKYYKQYGYFEMRAKLCYGYGSWPAFWLLNHDTNLRPEVDIIEAYAGGENAGNGGWSDTNNKPRTYAASLHADLTNQVYQKNNADYDTTGQPDLSADFHLYACHWDSTGLQFFFDGQPIDAKKATTAFTLRMFILLDLWFGSASGDPNNPGSNTPAPTGPSNSFQIDYIRVWDLATGGGSSGGGGSPPSDSTGLALFGEDVVWGRAPSSSPASRLATTPAARIQSLFLDKTVVDKTLPEGSCVHFEEGSGAYAGRGSAAAQIAALPNNVTHCLFEFGMYDFFQSQTTTQFKANLASICSSTVSNGRVPILIVPTPRPNENISAFQQAVRDQAAASSVLLIDLQIVTDSYLAANPGMTLEDIMPDGGTPNQAFSLAIADYIAARFGMLT